MLQPYVPGPHAALQPHEMSYACATYYLLPTAYYYLLGVL